MKVEFAEGRVVRLEMTRRNLKTLLTKLDWNAQLRPELSSLASACTLISPGGDVVVKAVEDDEHYRDRAPGPVLNNATGELE